MVLSLKSGQGGQAGDAGGDTREQDGALDAVIGADLVVIKAEVFFGVAEGGFQFPPPLVIAHDGLDREREIGGEDEKIAVGLVGFGFGGRDDGPPPKPP